MSEIFTSVNGALFDRDLRMHRILGHTARPSSGKSATKLYSTVFKVEENTATVSSGEVLESQAVFALNAEMDWRATVEMAQIPKIALLTMFGEESIVPATLLLV